MDKTVYEQVLLKNYKGAAGAEEVWDARAGHFNRSQQKDRSELVDKVMAILQERNLLSGVNLLDIGGGSGRYAVPFAAHADHVTITDVSAKMLELARYNAQEAGLNNLTYAKMEWTGADLAALEWRKRFDLVFASMCPAIRCPEGFYRMLEASKGFCLINQFIESTDSLGAYLTQALDSSRSYEPHNDRDMVQAVFNLLWLEGYEPEIGYLRQQEVVPITVEEAVAEYGGRYGQAAQLKQMDLAEVIARYAEQEGFSVSRKATLAMILWKV